MSEPSSESRDSHPPPDRPLLVYDGSCHFCRRWVARWQRETGETVRYAPYQEVAQHYPDIATSDWSGAVHLLLPDGTHLTGAAAVFRALADVRPVQSWLVAHIPGVSAVSDLVYRVIARNRKVASSLSRLWWGRQITPSSYYLARSVFLKGLAVVYLVAFWSMLSQVMGLVGSTGILPAESFLNAVRGELGASRLYYFPTLCWISSSDPMLYAICISGILASVLVLAGVLAPLALAWNWMAYLSLAVVGRVFFGYQWDNLLLEVGFLAIFFAPWQVRPSAGRETPPSRLFHFLLLFLLFRLMWGSGLVKLASGDSSWWPDLTAMNFHFETQPLPSWTAWYAHHLPASLHRAFTGMTLLMELAFPLLIFAPRSLRLIGFFALASLQAGILATGNFTFFNWLSLVLCVLLLDDGLFPRRWSASFQPGLPRPVRVSARWRYVVLSTPVAILLLVLSAHILFSQVSRCRVQLRGGAPYQGPAWVTHLYQAVSPFRSVNSYGLFAVMTRTRPELVVQGTMDGRRWENYSFKYKPLRLDRRPQFVAPHQPRLDWQLWFASLRTMNNPQTRNWMLAYLVRLLQGSPAVLSLMDENPFPNRPPRQVRVLVYEYRFSTPEERAESGVWWTRGEPKLFCPPIPSEQPDPAAGGGES